MSPEPKTPEVTGRLRDSDGRPAARLHDLSSRQWKSGIAGWLAKWIGYRRAILWMCLAFSVSIFEAYHVPRNLGSLLFWMPVIGFCSGMFGLFTMYLPPLFPTLFRTTGAGFCYNIGRIPSPPSARWCSDFTCMSAIFAAPCSGLVWH